MAVVSYTMQSDLVVNGKVRASGSTITVSEAEPMTLLDLEAVDAIDAEYEYVTPTEE